MEVLQVSLDLTTLRLLRRRDRYERLARSVPKKALDTRTQIIFDDMGAFFAEFPDVQEIEPGPFWLWFRGFKHPNIKDEAAAVLEQIIRQVAEDVDPALEDGLIKRLASAAAAFDITTLIEQFNAGEEVDIARSVAGVVDAYDKQVKRTIKNPQVLDPIEDLLKAEENDEGLHWRLPCLNRHIKPLVGGDFVIVAARVDVGKTTFTASELTHMAAQVDALYPDQKRSILWFNNEGPGKRIVTRCFQAALNATMEELVAKSNAGTIRDEYRAALGGRGGALRIFDIHGMWSHDVEDLMEKHKPALVLFDMIDNIRFGGEAGNNGQRTDQLLEAMYQWARMMGVKYDCVVIATSQISAEGDGLQFPAMSMLKDSKTGKAGAADLIITIGKVNDPMLTNSRYIGAPKSKKVRTGVQASPMCEVLFNGDRARYVEVPT